MANKIVKVGKVQLGAKDIRVYLLDTGEYLLDEAIIQFYRKGCDASIVKVETLTGKEASGLFTISRSSKRKQNDTQSNSDA